MQPVLLIIDMLQDFFLEGSLADNRQELCRSVNNLVQYFRMNNYPIIWVRQEFKPSLDDAFLRMKETGNSITIEGTNGCLVLPELDQKSGDFEIVKKRYSAFFGTELDPLLKKLTPQPLVIAGVNTHACVRTSAIDAYQRDIKIIIATDCVSSYDTQYHQESLRYLEQSIGILKPNAEIIEEFGAKKAR